MAETDQINFTLSLDAEDVVVKLLTSVRREKLLQIIKDIDAGVEDWDFTMELADHFSSLRSDWEKKQDEDAMEHAANTTVSIRPPHKVLSCGCNEVDVTDGMGHYGDCRITQANFAQAIAERKRKDR